MAKKQKKSESGLTDSDRKMLQHKIDCEGFDYCFVNYSDWQQISDPEFHRLREAYVDAANALQKYVGELE